MKVLKSYCKVRYLVECLGYSAFILEFYIAFDIILICFTGDCFINVFVFQTPDGNRFAKEIGLECGFV